MINELKNNTKLFKEVMSSGNPIDLLTTLKNVFRFLSVSSLFVGITGFFQTFVGYTLLEETPNIQICFSVFLMTFSLYSLNKITDIKEDSINMPERVRFLKGRTNAIVTYSIAAYLLCMLLILLDKPTSIAIVLIPLIANALYGSRLIPGLPRLKDIPVMKNIVVAISWATVTTLLPSAHIVGANLTIVLVLYFMLAKAFINTALYDLRDIIGDKEKGVRTIPVLIGPKKTSYILLAINTTLLPLLMLMGASIRFFAAALVIFGYIYIIYFSNVRNLLAMDLFVDGEWMLMSIGLLLLKEFGLA